MQLYEGLPVKLAQDQVTCILGMLLLISIFYIQEIKLDELKFLNEVKRDVTSAQDRVPPFVS